MALVTRCPHCATFFRVTPLHLQAHRGEVRCGQCAQVFDGFATLTTISDLEAMDFAKAEAGVENVHQAPEVPADATAPDQGDSPALKARPVVGQADLPETPVVEKAKDKANPELGIQGAERGARETREMGAPPAEKAEKKTAGKGANSRGGTANANAGSSKAHGPNLGEWSRVMQDDRTGRYFSDKYPFRATQSMQASLGWAIGSLFLLVVLVSQIIYLYRADIAVIAPATKPFLEEYCEMLECTVSLSAYEQLPYVASQKTGLGKQSSGRITPPAGVGKERPFSPASALFQNELSGNAGRDAPGTNSIPGRGT